MYNTITFNLIPAIFQIFSPINTIDLINNYNKTNINNRVSAI